jgi:hypothetical protein
LIVITCGTGPYSLAFPEAQSTASIYVDFFFNFFFFLDIVQNFFSAYQTPNLTVVDEPKVIFSIPPLFIENSKKVLSGLVFS